MAINFDENMNKENIMDGQSLSPRDEKLNQLKAILPEAFAEGKIDWEKLKAALGEDINFSNERYVLNWAGKSDAFRVLQAPSTRTLVPCQTESVNFDETQNLFIEGENLEVLKVLQKSYFGKVKMIYIDPPYNTGNDSFIYPDKFAESKEDYLKRVGDKDEDGYMTKEGMFQKNSKENGQYHSNWLNMMYPRLFLAKNLLKQDGVIFVSIDDHEVHNLRMIMNEVFGEENFIANIIWEKKYSPSNDSKWLSDNHDFILVFSKNKDVWRPQLLSRTEEQNGRYTNRDNDPRGVWKPSDFSVKTYSESYVYEIQTPSGKIASPPPGRCWGTSKDKFLELVSDNRIWFGEKGDSVPSLKRFLSDVKDGIVPTTIWKYGDVGHNQEGRKEIKELFDNEGYFDGPKPVRLLKRILSISSQGENDLVVDFFGGSGTIAHAVMDLNKEDGGNRKYICVQLPEMCDEKSEAYKAGYKTIADIAKERIRRVIEKIHKGKNGQIPLEDKKVDLGFKVFKLSDSNFKQWRGDMGKDAAALEEQMKLFVNPVSETATAENMVYELMLKSGKNLNSKLEHKDNYYCVNGNELVLMLEKANQEIVNAVLQEKPQKVIALDMLFEGNDQLKTNTALQMRDAGVEFKTI